MESGWSLGFCTSFSFLYVAVATVCLDPAASFSSTLRESPPSVFDGREWSLDGVSDFARRLVFFMLRLRLSAWIRQPASLLRFEPCRPYSADDQFAFQIEGLMKSAVYPSHAPPRGSA